jgi:hypothetical protein
MRPTINQVGVASSWLEVLKYIIHVWRRPDKSMERVGFLNHNVTMETHVKDM